MRAIPLEPCLGLIHTFEQAPGGGFAATPYRDSAGHWTIGWGHKQDGPYPSIMSREEADALALDDLHDAAEGVCDALGALVDGLTEGQYAALVDFAFNLGAGAFAGSTLCHLIKVGNMTKAVEQFPLWVHAKVNGKSTVLQGLVKRRAAEVKVWLA